MRKDTERSASGIIELGILVPSQTRYISVNCSLVLSMLFTIYTAAMNDPIRPPFRADIPEPVLLSPPIEHLTKSGTYIPPSMRPFIRLDENSDISEMRQLTTQHDAFRVRRWTLPSWGWIGIRTYYGHSDAEWETFRRKVVGAYYVLEFDEGDKFRILWVEDREHLEGADNERTRE